MEGSAVPNIVKDEAFFHPGTELLSIGPKNESRKVSPNMHKASQPLNGREESIEAKGKNPRITNIHCSKFSRGQLHLQMRIAYTCESCLGKVEGRLALTARLSEQLLNSTLDYREGNSVEKQKHFPYAGTSFKQHIPLINYQCIVAIPMYSLVLQS